MRKLFLSILFICIYTISSLAQISRGGIPLSFKTEFRNPDTDLIQVKAPDLQALRSEDESSGKDGRPPRVAVDVSVNKSIENSGTWNYIDGKAVWQLMITAPGALALSVSFNSFHLPASGKLFIYNHDRTDVLGAYTLYNNRQDKLFSTELIFGDTIIIEYEQDRNEKEKPELQIASVGYAYRMVSPAFENSSRAGACEVNINCPEGDNWQDQKRGVARIYLKNGSSYYWCTGSLVNNTSLDRKPYFLTANHCSPNPSSSDLALWIFYFNYEAPGCDPPTVTPSSNTMSGATFVANAALTGSDFLLLKLKSDVPVSYDPFYNGWDITGNGSPKGVTIHHPAGSSKKISTYTSPLISSTWEGGTSGTHWEVTWSETESGWGVTEGGSSGSPLFDNNQRIVGTLTGGFSACVPNTSTGTGPDKPDYYGKLSYSWDQNSTDPSHRLMDWLDPQNTGITQLNGMNPQLRADFKSDVNLILVGGDINYSDYSSGKPLNWKWFFQGGEPAEVYTKDPPPIKYNNAGYFSTTLIVSDSIVSDTVVKTNFIEVVGKIYPNPTTGKFNVFLGSEPPDYLVATIYNNLGQKVFEREYKNNVLSILPLDLTGISTNGIYFVKVVYGDHFYINKLSLIR